MYPPQKSAVIQGARCPLSKPVIIKHGSSKNVPQPSYELCFVGQFGSLGKIRIVSDSSRGWLKVRSGSIYCSICFALCCVKAKREITCFLRADVQSGDHAVRQSALNCTLFAWTNSTFFMSDVLCNFVRWIEGYYHSTVSDAFYLDIWDYIGVKSQSNL